MAEATVQDKRFLLRSQLSLNAPGNSTIRVEIIIPSSSPHEKPLANRIGCGTIFSRGVSLAGWEIRRLVRPDPNWKSPLVPLLNRLLI